MPGAPTTRRLPLPRVSTGRPRSPFEVLTVVVCVGLAALILYPISRVVLELFYDDGQLTLDTFRAVGDEKDLARVLLNTGILVLVAGSLALVLGSFLAWLNERTDARVGVLTDALPLVPFLLPTIAAAVGWVLLLSPRAGFVNTLVRAGLSRFGFDLKEGPFDVFSWWGLVFVTMLYLVPYAFLIVSAGLRNLDPALDEQARVSGAGLLRTAVRVTLPSVAPSIAGAALLILALAFAFVSVPIIIGTGAGIEVLSVRIIRLLTFTYPARTATAVCLSMIMLVVLVIAWRLHARTGARGLHATVGGKGRASSRIALGRWRWPARVLLLGYVIAALVLPVCALLVVTLNGYWTNSIAWSHMDLDSFRSVLFENENTRAAFTNSIGLGAVGATIGMLIAALVSMYVHRSQGRLAKAIDGVVKLPQALSNLVIAVGFVLALSGPPFNLGGSLLILLLAYLVIHLPQGSIAADAAASQVGSELTEASSVFGASGARTFVRVSLPIMLPGLTAGWALLFVRNVGDLDASAILGGTNNPVVGRQVLEIFENGSFANLAALTMTLTLVTSTVLVALLVFARWTDPNHQRLARGRTK